MPDAQTYYCCFDWEYSSWIQESKEYADFALALEAIRGGDGTWEGIKANSAEAAAELWLDQWEHHNAEFSTRSLVVVTDRATVRFFVVEAESVRVYSAVETGFDPA